MIQKQGSVLVLYNDIYNLWNTTFSKIYSRDKEPRISIMLYLNETDKLNHIYS